MPLRQARVPNAAARGNGLRCGVAKREPARQPSETERLFQIKRWAIVALVSDDFLRDRLVLKGGTAVDLIHCAGVRASVDVDFSIEGDFSAEELEHMHARIEMLLVREFETRGLRAFDVKFEHRPPEVSPDLAAFWGGYRISFKLVTLDRADTLRGDPQALRRNAEVVGPAQRRTFEIDISRHEFCGDKEAYRIGDRTVYAYSPSLVIAEKLRAICQQMPEYRAIVRSPHGSPRARDFFDIYQLVRRYSVHTATPQFASLLEKTFAAKRVPAALLRKIADTREFHRLDFPSVAATVPPGEPPEDFDTYFDFVLRLVADLEALWHE